MSVGEGAVFSEDRRYRYVLRRRWGPGDRIVLSLGVNPSDADEKRNDPTITRERDFYERLGFDGFDKMNAFAFVSSDPAVLLQTSGAVGPENDAWLKAEIAACQFAVACWGAHPRLAWRFNQVLHLFNGRRISCFGLTKGGYPRHPLYLPKSTELVSYR